MKIFNIKKYMVVILTIFVFTLFCFITYGTNKPVYGDGETVLQNVEKQTKPEGGDTMKLFVGDKELPIIWEDNESIKALKELVKDKPLTIQMSMYGGFEQVGSLGTNLPRNDVQTTTTSGDIVLYSGNQIVMFYGSNSWAYTRLGKAANTSASEMAKLLGNGNVTITLSMNQ